jgi:hypothetical protein
MSSRFSTFSEFWPFYVGEHRQARCRVLHFVGTLGFFSTIIFGLVLSPVRMGACLAAGILVLVLARKVEAKRRAIPEVISLAVLWTLGSPWVLGGIVWAYAWAWTAHARIEHNRPATFVYPLWSLIGDYKMVTMMLMGQLWTGDLRDRFPDTEVA